MGKFRTYIILPSGERLDFILDVGKRKKLAICLSEGELIVRVPIGCGKKVIQDFIFGNIEWINENLKKSGERVGLPKSYEDGEKIKLLGEIVTILYCFVERYKPAEITDGKLNVYICKNFTHDFVKNQVDKLITNLAEEKIKCAMDKMISVTGISPAKITIKLMSASWGRCISNGNISLNFKLVTQPEQYIEYVCLHELCHLVHMNHSKEFWALVEKYCPDWKYIREKMKE